MGAGGGDHMLGPDLEGFGGDEGVALLDHPAAGDDPARAGPAQRVDLGAGDDLGPEAARALGHGPGDADRVDMAVLRVEERAPEVVGGHERPAGADPRRGQEFAGDADALGDRGAAVERVHALAGLGHVQRARGGEAGIDAGFGL